MYKLLLGTLFLSIYGNTYATTFPPTTTKSCESKPLEVKWYRDSAEKNALYLEIFKLSEPILLANKKQMVKPGNMCGVIFDIDETLIDNSLFQYNNVKQCAPFSWSSWTKFVKSEASTATPGAAAITNFIHGIGCKVDIVSNRTIDTQSVTEELLKKQGIYFDQVILTENSKMTDKNPRFKAIIQGIAPSKIKYPQTIIGYYGDNIEDFPQSKQVLYLNKDSEATVYANFGTTYFALPNPMYGSWLKNKYN